jgi:acyl-lipid omega-6 desaturase (Delta-12 desaturase)
MAEWKKESPIFDARLARKLREHGKADAKRATYELAITLIPFTLVWLSLLLAWEGGHVWLYAGLLPVAAALLVRLFMIQHDCGHRSFFPGRRANDWLGRVISVVTLVPYDHWRQSHAIHHASSGNLGRRGIGDVLTLTVAEYLARPRWGRLKYRLYRHPVVMFGLGPAYLFLLHNRLPFGLMGRGWRPWLGTMATNAAIGGAAASMIAAVGLSSFLWVHVPVVMLAASAGVWLFYVQHQFENTYWATPESWNARAGALHGSSHYDLPRPLRWFTANIGIHHVHHLSSRIPYYRLPEVLGEHPQLGSVSRITLGQSLKGLRMALWDEERCRLVPFDAVRAESGV